MIPRALCLTTFGTALGCALTAGAFFAFSTFVMKALGSLPAAQAVRAMQAFNVFAPTGLFLAALLGTALASAALTLQAVLGWSEPGASLRLAGSLAYLLGAFGVTLVANVPRNDALAALDPDSASTVAAWTGYLSGWTAWNHVRTVAALLATALLILSFLSTAAGAER
jgi:uncharacterized membrane protein